MALKIQKVLNNNVAIAGDERGKDIIVMGSGVAFGKKRGDTIDESMIERIFTQQESGVVEKFQQLLAEIPEEYLEVADQIILLAEKRLGQQFGGSLYIALTDHIHFAVLRCREGMAIENRLLTEVRMMYRDEFEVSKEAIGIINKAFDVDLPIDEAAFIAFHFVNAETTDSMQETMQHAKIVQDALTIVKNNFKIELPEESLDYYRLVTHLKFFAQRMMQGKQYTPVDPEEKLFRLVETSYPEAFACMELIAKYIQLEYGYHVSNEERLYLTIHLERIREVTMTQTD